MVAIIKSGYSIHRTFNYNENKVKKGVAKCIGAGNYPLDPEDMSVGMRLNGLLNRIELSQRCKRNSVHISLNFDPSEKDMTEEKMLTIADAYMNECNTIGEILLHRYDLLIHSGTITHATTNLNANELEKLYGNRVRSRLREMFNLITFPENAEDLRK